MLSWILPKNERWGNFMYWKLPQRSFFERIQDAIICFWDLLTFSTKYKCIHFWLLFEPFDTSQVFFRQKSSGIQWSLWHSCVYIENCITLSICLSSWKLFRGQASEGRKTQLWAIWPLKQGNLLRGIDNCFTLPIAKILSVKNAQAWVSMVSYFKK